jgi:predicted nucleic acid-binding protein
MSDGTDELVIFDTDIISECLRQNAQALAFLTPSPPLHKLVERGQGGEVPPIERRRTTVINEGELLTGRYQQLQTADTVERIIFAQQRLDQTKAFLATFPAILPMDEEAASIFFDISRQRGVRKIGRRDLMIAAIAVRHCAILVTGNVQHFARVPRLKVRDWREY